MTTAMGSMDAAFLHMETRRAPMQTLQVLVFHGRPVSLDQLAAAVEAWARYCPGLRCRVVTSPWGLGQPRWVNDPNFSPRAHLSRVHLVGADSHRAFSETLSRMAAEPLPRHRPLWEGTVVEGLGRNEWAFVLKLHHALADGQAKANALRRMLTSSRPPTHAPEDAVRDAPVDAPAGAPLWRRTLSLPLLVGAALRGRWRLWLHRRRRGMYPARVFHTERLSFNRTGTSRRALFVTEMKLSRLQAIRGAAGCTFNDLIVTLVTGGLMRYLRRRGELPTKPLVASVPIALEKDRERFMGNRVSSIFASLPVHINHPLARLQYVSSHMAAAKDELPLRGIDAVRWVDALPPFLFRGVVQLLELLRPSRFLRPPVNLVVSCVRGPTSELQLAGRRLTAVYSVGPLLGNVGLNFTVWSYNGRVGLAVLGNPDLNPDLERLTQDLHQELEALECALLGCGAGVQSR